MVSQLLFGEYVSKGEEKDDFVSVVCLYDGYEGWVQANQLTPVEEVSSTTLYVGGAEGKVTINGIGKALSIGSPVYQPGKELQIGGVTVQYPADDYIYWNSESMEHNFAESLQSLYQPYIYTPYLWGGKSVFGIDCSGFVQQVFKLFGVKLLRDAYLQAEQGTGVANFNDAKIGDIAFFQNENGRITHVGIVLVDNAIVHASGRVRIDTIDAEGIVQKETRKRTHRLHSIRRFF